MSDAVAYICIAVVVILCVGEPDLLDAIIQRVGECKAIAVPVEGK